METIDNLDQKNVALEVTEHSKFHLKTAASWSKFMAILGFVGIGLMAMGAIVAIPMGSFMNNYLYSSFPYALIGVSYLAIAILVFFPTLFLFRFSQKTASALAMNNPVVLEDAFQNMKRYWKFTGIMTIVALGICMIILPVVVIVAVVSTGAFAY